MYMVSQHIWKVRLPDCRVHLQLMQMSVPDGPKFQTLCSLDQSESKSNKLGHEVAIRTWLPTSQMGEILKGNVFSW